MIRFWLQLLNNRCRVTARARATRFDSLFEGALILVGAADLHGVKLQPQLLGRRVGFLSIVAR